MRGYFRPVYIPVLREKLFPAYAGVFPGSLRLRQCSRTLPRLCGGISGTGTNIKGLLNSSPPMRGYFPQPAANSLTASLFPAYAGVFPRRRLSPCLKSTLPRLCGGISTHTHQILDSLLSSPPMRGYFRLHRRDSGDWHLFPAYAGVFPTPGPLSSGSGSLPRLCGGISKWGPLQV